MGVLTERRLQALLGEPVRTAKPRLGCTTVASLVENGAGGPILLRPSGELAAVQFSSGSTGSPKPVMLSHTNMLANARAILNALPGDSRDHSGVSWLPLYHDMGLVGCLLSAMVGQGQLTLFGPERLSPNPSAGYKP